MKANEPYILIQRETAGNNNDYKLHIAMFLAGFELMDKVSPLHYIGKKPRTRGVEATHYGIKIQESDGNFEFIEHEEDYKRRSPDENENAVYIEILKFDKDGNPIEKPKFWPKDGGSGGLEP